MIVIEMDNLPNCCLECNLNFDQIWDDGGTTNFCVAKQESIGDPNMRPTWCPLHEY